MQNDPFRNSLISKDAPDSPSESEERAALKLSLLQEQQQPSQPSIPEKRNLLSSFLAFFVDMFQVLIVVGGISLLIRFYVVQPFVVLGSSMQPYLDDNQLLMIDEISYRFGEPQRGDIIVLNPPHDSRDFIKRIIGLPGEQIQITSEGKVLINQMVLNEPYLSDANRLTRGVLDITLGSDEYFVLGDNRAVSNDSRGGVDPRSEEAISPWTISKKDITGRAFLRWWPIEKITLIEHHDYKNGL